ncbi:MAG: Na+/H+ antiporter subunit D [Acholeplasmataceae bacterium]|nr:MAG: Na+/H+ antiporter subunit D [Acholeplasmataceae bacterium]
MSKKHGAALMFVSLLIFWLILAARFDWTTIIAGFFVSLLIVFYNLDLIFNNQEATTLTVRALKALIVLVFVLVFNVIKANFQVAKIVLSPKMPIHPGFKTIRQPLKKELNQALFGNAITLTPGTLTVDMNQDEIIIHGLRVEHIQDVQGSRMEQAFIRLEGEEKP